MARKLSEIRVELKHRMHLAVKTQHIWLSAVLRGHYQYFGVMFEGQPPAFVERQPLDNLARLTS